MGRSRLTVPEFEEVARAIGEKVEAGTLADAMRGTRPTDKFLRPIYDAVHDMVKGMDRSTSIEHTGVHVLRQRSDQRSSDLRYFVATLLTVNALAAGGSATSGRYARAWRTRESVDNMVGGNDGGTGAAAAIHPYSCVQACLSPTGKPPHAVTRLPLS